MSSSDKKKPTLDDVRKAFAKHDLLKRETQQALLEFQHVAALYNGLPLPRVPVKSRDRRSPHSGQNITGRK